MAALARQQSAGSAIDMVADSSNHGARNFFSNAGAAGSDRSIHAGTEPEMEDQSMVPPGKLPPPKATQMALRVEPDAAAPPGLRGWVVTYVRKFRGHLDTPLPVPGRLDLFVSWAGAFLGILALSGLSQWLRPAHNFDLLIPSFGASAVLVFGVIDSKLAQPRNFIGGQVLSAVVGCAVRVALQDVIWLSAALGMSLALLVMMVTKTTHPPGGATALIAATAKPLRPGQGFQLVGAVLVACIVMQLIALLVNNLHYGRRYPTYWFGFSHSSPRVVAMRQRLAALVGLSANQAVEPPPGQQSKAQQPQPPPAAAQPASR